MRFAKIIFLDIDGVLNKNRAHQEGAFEVVNYLNPESVARINRIIERTGAGVVVTSTWRIGKRRVELQEAFVKNGFAGTIAGMTPNEGCKHPGLECNQGHRGAQIRQWLEEHAEIDRAPERFVIIDDSSDMIPYLHLLVRVDGAKEIADADVEAAVEILNRWSK